MHIVAVSEKVRLRARLEIERHHHRARRVRRRTAVGRHRRGASAFAAEPDDALESKRRRDGRADRGRGDGRDVREGHTSHRVDVSRATGDGGRAIAVVRAAGAADGEMPRSVRGDVGTRGAEFEETRGLAAGASEGTRRRAGGHAPKLDADDEA